MKLERVVFSDFGLMLGQMPEAAKFTVMKKDWAKGGSGRGAPTAGPTEWSQLRHYLDTLAYVRNATAHADVGKLESCPKKCEGELWLRKENGSWSVQQPHGLTAVRAVLSIYNTVADGLHTCLGQGVSLELTRPNTVDYPSTGIAP